MDEIGSSVLALNALIAAIVLGVPLVLIAIVARDARRGRRDGADVDDPTEDVLATYAEGHVDQVEFERLRSTMQRR